MIIFYTIYLFLFGVVPKCRCRSRCPDGWGAHFIPIPIFSHSSSAAAAVSSAVRVQMNLRSIIFFFPTQAILPPLNPSFTLRACSQGGIISPASSQWEYIYIVKMNVNECYKLDFVILLCVHSSSVFIQPPCSILAASMVVRFILFKNVKCENAAALFMHIIFIIYIM